LARSLLDLEKVHQSDEVMKGFYNRLKTLCILWSEDYVKEKELYKEEFKYYFKFINKESVSYLKKFDEFKAVREEYKSKFEKVKKMQIKPAKDLELVKFDLIKEYAEQGYDIYDKSSDFYNDFCTPASSGDNDITLEDRKEDIYPQNVITLQK